MAIPIGEMMYDFLALAFVGVAAFVLGVRVGIGAAQSERSR